MTTSTPDPLVLKLRSPDDILEAVPYLLGFEPARCLVALSLRGERLRLGLTLRVDLADPAGTDVVARQVVSSLRADGAESVVMVAYAGADRAELDGLVAATRRHLRSAGVPVADALRVHGGRWTSYLCRRSTCCPPAGTVVRDRVGSPSPVGSAAVAAGHRVFPQREALAATLASVTGLLRTSMEAALDRETERYVAGHCFEHPEQAAATVELVRRVLLRAGADELKDGGRGPVPLRLAVNDAARIIVGVLDVQARDALLDGWDMGVSTGRSRGLDAELRPAADTLWSELIRRAVIPGLVAPVATLLAWNLYIHHGGGALVSIALERALDDVPGYVMAEGLVSILQGGVSPERFAAMVAAGTDPPAAPVTPA